IEAIGRPTVLALTATATEEVIDDILRQLHITDAEIVHTGFYRPNLYLATQSPTDEDDRRERFLEILHARRGASGIVYVSTVKEVEQLADFRSSRSFSVGMYHGRLKASARIETQDRFMADEI